MHYFESESTIAASPAEVWAVLSRASDWPNWDSGVDAVEGTVGPGAKVTVRSHVGALLGMIWKSIPDLSDSFQQFATGLKKKVEGA